MVGIQRSGQSVTLESSESGRVHSTTLVAGLPFAFALNAAPPLDRISFNTVTPATALVAGLAVLVLLVGVHENQQKGRLSVCMSVG